MAGADATLTKTEEEMLRLALPASCTMVWLPGEYQKYRTVKMEFTSEDGKVTRFFGTRYRLPMTTVDAVLFWVPANKDPVRVAMVKRNKRDEPFFGCWALPGGFRNYGDSLAATFKQEMFEELGLTKVHVGLGPQPKTAGEVRLRPCTFLGGANDPRGERTSAVYAGAVLGIAPPRLVPIDTAEVAGAAYLDVAEVLQSDNIAFDHKAAIVVALSTELFPRIGAKPVLSVFDKVDRPKLLAELRSMPDTADAQYVVSCAMENILV
jgi:ADP-ribose pyrophosphatase YjhB (NUDIX family)